MTDSPLIITLAQWLAGEFANPTQAIDQPVWFVHLHLWHRPIPHRLQGHLALFAEQANVLKLDQPYRQRVLLLQETDIPHQLQIQYLAFRQPEQFRGAGAHPDRLQALSLADLESLPGCVLKVTYDGTTFKGQMPAEAKCYFQYEGQTRQVILGFEAEATQFRSYDRGVDTETGQALWGALMGPYEFQKCQDLAVELPLP